MPLPKHPNPISILDLINHYYDFAGPVQVPYKSLEDYYRGGYWVRSDQRGFPLNGSAQLIPSSGSISLGDFHNVQKYWSFATTGNTQIPLSNDRTWRVKIFSVGGGGGGGAVKLPVPGYTTTVGGTGGAGSSVYIEFLVTPSTTPAILSLYPGGGGGRGIVAYGAGGGAGGISYATGLTLDGLTFNFNGARGGNGGVNLVTGDDGNRSAGGGGGAASVVTLYQADVTPSPTIISIAGGGGGGGAGAFSPFYSSVSKNGNWVGTVWVDQLATNFYPSRYYPEPTSGGSLSGAILNTAEQGYDSYYLPPGAQWREYPVRDAQGGGGGGGPGGLGGWFKGVAVTRLGYFASNAAHSVGGSGGSSYLKTNSQYNFTPVVTAYSTHAANSRVPNTPAYLGNPATSYGYGGISSFDDTSIIGPGTTGIISILATDVETTESRPSII